MSAIYFVAILMGSALGLAVGFGVFLSEVKERKERPQELTIFREALSAALLRSDLTWDQLQQLARHHGITPFDIKRSLDALASRALTGEYGDCEDMEIRIQNALLDLEKEEPFQGLPDEIRLHLRHIQNQMNGSGEHLLQPLAQKLKTLLVEHEQGQRRQRWVAWASFTVGLLSLGAGLFAYLR